MSPEWLEARERRGLTYLRDVDCDEVYINSKGELIRKIKEHGSHHDVWVVVNESKNQEQQTYGGCAEVLVVRSGVDTIQNPC